MQAAVGGNIRYPNLQSICDLFRTSINDTANNTTGTGVGSGNQAGLIMPNSNPDLLTFLNSACEDTFIDLRNVGSPELILDNWILTGLPPVNSNLGPGVANPASQVALSYAGYFDGVQWYPNWTLPIGLSKMLAVSQRQTGGNQDFAPLRPFPAGIPGTTQSQLNAGYEMRQGEMWMNGATQQVDIRLRCRISFPPFLGSNINFATAYVPILDSKNAIAAKMTLAYAERFAPEMIPAATAKEARFMGKLRLQNIRERQNQENQRSAFGDEAVADFSIAWSWL
jgi:hypothetical protein